MPLGVSANSIGLDGRPTNTRLLLMVGIPLLILLSVTFGSWLVVQSVSLFRTKHLTNGAYTYSFSFYKSAETVNLDQGVGLQYGTHAWVIAKPTTDEVVNDCASVAGKWQNAFTARVEGAERPVCTDGSTTFFVTFYHGTARHLFEITYSDKKDVNQDYVRKFIESLRVTLD